MIEWIKNLFVAIFGSNSALATLFVSMVPIIELRGAIPIGLDKGLWGENALSLWASFGWSVLGCTIICVILSFAFWPLFNWLKTKKWCKKLTTFVENKIVGNSKAINGKVSQEKSERKIFLIKFFGVMLFVAIPLPGTGVWTGTCLALFVGLERKWTILSVVVGNLFAGLIMTLLSYFFIDSTWIVLVAFLILIAIFVVVALIKNVIRKKKSTVEVAKDFENN